MNTSVYEVWVSGLRLWQEDPTTDLGHLPPLAVDTFTPATYERLLGHLHAALDRMMELWNLGLTKSLQAAANDHERERALVQSRLVLARRVQLVRHPGFPPEISTALLDATRADIRTLQADLERVLLQSTARGSSDREAQGGALRIVRRAPLTVLIEPGFDLDAFLAGTTPVAPPPSAAPVAAQPDLPPLLSAAPRRRIVVD